MNVLEILLLGTLVSAGFVWQWHLFTNKDEWGSFFRYTVGYYLYLESYEDLPPRTRVPLLTGIIVFLGWTSWGAVRLFDQEASFGVLDLLRQSGAALLFAATLTLKSVFAPLYLAFSLVLVTYYAFEHNTFMAVEFVSSALSLVFNPCPQWAKYAYAAATCLYATGASIYDGDIIDWT